MRLIRIGTANKASRSVRPGRLAATAAGAAIGGFWIALAASGQPDPTPATPPATQPVPAHSGASSGERLDISGDPLPAGALARLGTQRFRAGAPIAGVAVSPDGKLLATVQLDGTLGLWDRATGRLLKSFESGSKYGGELAFTPDSKRLVHVPIQSGKASVWNLETGRREWEALVRGAVGYRAGKPSFSADGKYLATAASNNQVAILSLADGKVMHQVGISREPITGFALTPDGKTLLTCSPGIQGLRQFDVATGKDKGLLKTDTKVRSFALAPDGKALAILSSEDASVAICDAATGKQTNTLTGGLGFQNLVFSADGRYLLAQEYHCISLFDVATGTDRVSIPGATSHAASPPQTAFTPDGRTLCYATGNVLRFWDLEKNAEVLPQAGHTAPIQDLGISPDGRWVYTQGADQMLRLWDAAGQLVHQRAAEGRNQQVAFTPDGRSLVWAGKASTLRFFDIPALAAAGDPPPSRELDLGTAFTRFTLGFGGSVATLQTSGSALTTVDLSGPKVLYTTVFPNAPNQVSPRAISSDLRHLAATWQQNQPGPGRWGGGANANANANAREMRVYALDGGALLARLTSEPAISDRCDFSADGTLLLTDSGKSLELTEVLTGKPVARLNLPAGESVTALVLSPDGRLAAVGASSHTVRVFDLMRGKELAAFTGHRGTIIQVAWRLAPAAPRLVSGSQDTTALLWDLAPALARLERLPTRLSDADAENWPRDLASEAPETAVPMAWRLVAAGDQAVERLAARLQPRGTDAKLAAHIREQIQRLDHDEFRERDAAQAELYRLYDRAEATLRDAWKSHESTEVRDRIGRVLSMAAERPQTARKEELGDLRAIQVLESIRTPAAAKVLARMAEGEPGERVTAAAKAAIARLQRAAQ